MGLCKLQTHQGLEGMQHVIEKLNSDLVDILSMCKLIGKFFLLRPQKTPGIEEVLILRKGVDRAAIGLQWLLSIRSKYW